ncbi:MAG: YfiR family protein [Sulfuricella sp.]|nr:YfiR family protein [Sulfuricella sp.]
MVNFYLEQNKVRFEINNEAAGRAGLKVSSQLLKLARIVQDNGGVK